MGGQREGRRGSSGGTARVVDDADMAGGKWWLAGDDIKASAASGAQIRGRQWQGTISRQRRPAKLGFAEGIMGEVEVGEARLRMAREKPDEAAAAERKEGGDAGDGGRVEVEDSEGGREAGAEPVREGAGDEERSDRGDENSKKDEGTKGLAVEEGATKDDERGGDFVGEEDDDEHGRRSWVTMSSPKRS